MSLCKGTVAPLYDDVANLFISSFNEALAPWMTARGNSVLIAEEAILVLHIRCRPISTDINFSNIVLNTSWVLWSGTRYSVSYTRYVVSLHRDLFLCLRWYLNINCCWTPAVTGHLVLCSLTCTTYQRDIQHVGITKTRDMFIRKTEDGYGNSISLVCVWPIEKECVANCNAQSCYTCICICLYIY